MEAGSVHYGTYQSKALGEAERVQGQLLLCCSTPLSDLQLRVREVAGVSDIAIKKMPCRVNEITRAADDVAILKLQLPANEIMQFMAGQYIEFLLKDGRRRAYSIANPPHEQGFISLHIRHMPGGAFTDQVFGVMKERDILRFEGPMGTFFLREDSKKPIIMLASGTGFAPIKSMIEHSLHKNMTRPIRLYWGARQKKDIYFFDLARQWAEQYEHIEFIPVLSNAAESDQWTGRTGLVHHAVMSDVPDMSGVQVYACGVPVMVESARTDFIAQCRLPADEFYADAFTSEADAESSPR